jgi:hypothetical protein
MYEYLLKCFLYSGQKKPELLEMYNKAIEGMEHKLVKTWNDGKYLGDN